MTNLSLEAFIDHVGHLARARHSDSACALADAEVHRDPLRHHLAHAMIAATLDAQAAQRLTSHARAAHALAPNHALVAQALCMAHLAARRFVEAEHEARRAILLEDTPRARRGLANVQLMQGRDLDASQTLRDLLVRSPDVEAHLMLARISARRGDTLAALDAHASAWALAPERREALHATLDRFREAAWPLGVLMLTRISRATTETPEARALLDVTALQATRHLGGVLLDAAADMRRDVVQSLLELTPTLSPGLRIQAARALIGADQRDDAHAVLAMPLPEGASATLQAQHRHTMAVLKERTGDIAGALEDCVTAVALDPTGIDAACDALHHALTLGTAAAFEQARDVLAKVPVHLRRRSLVLTFNEATFRHRLGDDDEARRLVTWLEEAPGALATAVVALRERLASTRPR